MPVGRELKGITNLPYFFENIVNNVHNTVFRKNLLFRKLNHEFRKITDGIYSNKYMSGFQWRRQPSGHG